MPKHLLRDKTGFPQLSYSVDGQGPVIVLLHGFPEDSGLWRELTPSLSRDFTVVCPDLPGAGGSSLPSEGGLTIERMAEGVAAVVDEVSLAPFLLIGHSMGGYTALAFAEHWSTRLKGLALVHSTAAPDSEEKKSQRQKAIGLIRKGGKEAFMKEAVPAMFSEATRQSNPELVRQQIARGLMLPDKSAIAFYEAIAARPDRTKVLGNAVVPVQWILGGDDSIIPLDKVMEQTHLAPRSAVNVYESCGHLSMLEAPGRLAADLRQFADYCYKA
jgi:pimeloyl-ACP methyl ester carboxylesterase